MSSYDGMSNPDVAPGGHTASPWRLATVLLQHRRLLLGLPIVLGLGAGILSRIPPREYAATARFVPQEPISATVGFGQFASQLGFLPPQASTSSPQFYADLLESREVLREVVLTTYGDSSSGDSLRNLLDYYEIAAPLPDQAIAQGMDALLSDLATRLDRATGVVTFVISTPSPEWSVRIARRLLDIINEYNLRKRQSQARAEREFVERRLADAERDLLEAEDSLSSFLSRNRRIQDSPELVAEQERLQRRVQLNQQLYVTLAERYEAAKIDEVRNTPVITILEQPEGFVEPRPRGTIRKTLTAGFVGLFLALIVIFPLDYLQRVRERGDPNYLEFTRQLAASLGRWGRRGRRGTTT